MLHAVLARQLSADEYGLFALFLSLLAIIAILTNGGWMHSVVVLTSRYSRRRRWGRYRAVVLQALVSPLVISFLAAIPLYFVAPLVFSHADQVTGFRTGLLACPFLAVIMAAKGLLRGLGKPHFSILPDETLLPVLAAIIYFAFSTSNYLPAAYIYTALTAIIAALTVAFCWRLLPGEARNATSAFMARPWQLFAVPMVAGEIGNIFISRTDILMVAALSTPVETGGYSMAIRLAAMLLLAHVVVWPWYAGKFSHAHAGGDRALSKRLLMQSTMLAGGFALLPALVLLFYPQIAVVIFGETGETAMMPMRLLAIAYLIHAATGPLGLFMIMQGMHKDYSAIAWVAAILNVLLNLLLIPHYGATGAALTTLATFVVWKAILVIWIWRAWRSRPLNP